MIHCLKKKTSGQLNFTLVIKIILKIVRDKEDTDIAVSKCTFWHATLYPCLIDINNSQITHTLVLHSNNIQVNISKIY